MFFNSNIYILTNIIFISFINIINSSPNIIFILVDDVGFADLSYNNPNGPIQTPNIDSLANKGIKLNYHYTHPTCTPSRAALMTGKYAANVGLPFAMLPGSPVGLPLNIPTLPELLRKKANYSAHMVGKWHLGYSHWDQLPIGRGFESWVGIMNWDIDSYEKRMYNDPTTPMGIDWMKATEDGKYQHYAENIHATEILTTESINVMQRHVDTQPIDKPLFLYLAYTAAHSPLQPLQRHEESCKNIKHLWRKQYCGMVIGLDEAIKNITDNTLKILGDDTVLIFSSDNGASPWAGGLNYPLRSSKYTPYEGGVRVPAFVVDFSKEKKYFGIGGRINNNMMHLADWLPTLLAISNLDNKDINNDLITDGYDLSNSIRNEVESPRKDVLTELYYEGESMHPNLWTVSYRKGNYKLIEGLLEDTNYYYESNDDKMNTTDLTWVATIGEKVIRTLEYIFGIGNFDTCRQAMAVLMFHSQYIKAQGNGGLYLYDVINDPTESINLAESNIDIVDELKKDVENIKLNRPNQTKYWMVIDRKAQNDSYVYGDCSMNDKIKSQHCYFQHPFVTGDVSNIDKLVLHDGKLLFRQAIIFDMILPFFIKIMRIMGLLFVVKKILTKWR